MVFVTEKRCLSCATGNSFLNNTLIYCSRWLSATKEESLFRFEKMESFLWYIPNGSFPPFLLKQTVMRWSQWPSGLRRGSTAARLLGLRVRIPPGTRISVACECCVLSSRGPCDGPIPRPEESYRPWCVTIWDLQTSKMRRPWPALGCCARRRKLTK